MNDIQHAYEGETHPEQKNELDFLFVRDNIKELEGRMLTLIEAVVEKDRQKATKDIVRDQFSAKYNWLWEYAHVIDLLENPVK